MLQGFVSRHPRFAASLSFGVSTAILAHLAWRPDMRLSGAVPALNVAAGLAHAVAGVILGPRLMDRTRVRTGLQAAGLGASISLLAQVLFAPGMAAYVSASNVGPATVLGYLSLTFYAGLFAFLGAGWALLLLSAGVGLALHRLAIAAADPARQDTTACDP